MGMSLREIGLHFGVSRDSGRVASAALEFRLTPERLLLEGQAGSNGSAHLDSAVFFRALDALDQGVVFFNCDGTLLHANRAMAELFEAAPEGEALRREVEFFATTLCGLVRFRRLEEVGTVEPLATREVPTAGRRFRLQGSFIGLDLFSTGPSTLIAVEHPTPDPFSDASLRMRFRLTRQESRVARLLAQGWTNPEMAESLSISAYTVKRHTEHVLQKLQARSRAEVAFRILSRGSETLDDEK